MKKKYFIIAYSVFLHTKILSGEYATSDKCIMAIGGTFLEMSLYSAYQYCNYNLKLRDARTIKDKTNYQIWDRDACLYIISCGLVALLSRSIVYLKAKNQ